MASYDVASTIRQSLDSGNELRAALLLDGTIGEDDADNVPPRDIFAEAAAGRKAGRCRFTPGSPQVHPSLTHG